MKHYVLISACPSGVASCFLAADKLASEVSARELQLSVEIDSPLSNEPLDDAVLAGADCVLIASETVSSDLVERLKGRSVYKTTAQAILENPAAVIEQAEIASKPLEVSASQVKKVVAVTACPTGVAHTFMSAEALTEAGKALGYEILVEKQGSAGAKDPLTAEQISEADVVILATDIEVDTGRFVGKKVYRTSTGEALKKAESVLNRALTEGQELKAQTISSPSQTKKKKASGAYQHLLTGVSYMLPLVVAGGLIIALSFAFGINAFEQEGTLAAALMSIGGGSAFALMVPVLAGYIAFSIAERPGLAPGMIGGMLASTLGAGFLGGIIAGFIAGYSANGVKKVVRLPATMESLMPVLVIPLLSSLITGLLMVYVVGAPVKSIMDTMTAFLQSMNGTNALLLGMLLGAMMAFDMGGPVNKAAYTFGVGLITSQTYGPMAAVMAAGMVPPLGLALATLLAKRKFSKEELEGGKAAGILGLCFITEGAIPFAARDPLRVIPCSMVGAALTGALSMWMGIGLKAPHGGVFVMMIPEAISNVGGYAMAIALGSIVTGVAYSALRKMPS
ncbi:PTS fructose-like transporter subunit IIB [Endozoicomonas numazuensis]|uniref:protein-N(pi)-phosphohistidine--D-fructose phosphotransferase n=1 Tax=Endozoicomonas numazuensis TaxID=1137799 RepID=A0A081NGU1_9GAMM|nr:PTS fructose-like transporter subunit IIB [Endozoicomonas numazuensis]KEQ17664.1 PTS fructose transporter subunit IIBC [Endozoicomonas numazuensis]